MDEHYRPYFEDFEFFYKKYIYDKDKAYEDCLIHKAIYIFTNPEVLKNYKEWVTENDK